MVRTGGKIKVRFLGLALLLWIWGSVVLCSGACESERQGEGESELSGTEMEERAEGEGRRGGKRGGKRKRGRKSDGGGKKKYAKWRTDVPQEVLQGATQADLETVIAANKASLAALRNDQLTDLDNSTGCRTGSLEWIERIGALLKGVAEKMEGRGESGEEMGEGAEGLLDLVGQTARRYEVEASERRSFLEESANTSIPCYLSLLEGLLLYKETVLEIIRSEECAIIGGRVLAKILNTRAPTCALMITVIKKGLEDMAMGREIEDVRRHENVSARIDKRREIRSFESERGQYGVSVAKPLKHTLFYITMAALWYDCASDRYCFRYWDKRMGGEASLNFGAKAGAFRKRLEKILEKASELGEGEEAREVRHRVETLIGEIETVCSVYMHGLAYLAEGGTFFRRQILYIEAAETYLKNEAERENGDLEKLLAILYKAMRESGHLEVLQRESEETDLKGRYWHNSYKYKIAAAWLKIVSFKTSSLSVQVALLSEQKTREEGKGRKR